MQGEGTFVAGEEKNKVRLTLYDGGIQKNWYWGNLAFELSSMKLAKKKVPILYEHDTGNRLGYSTKVELEGKFIMEGELLDNEEAGRIKTDADGGFPFEASLRFDPERGIYEHIKEKEKVEVNGRVLKGPGTVIRNAVIMEASICVFGRLAHTGIETFDKQIKERR